MNENKGLYRLLRLISLLSKENGHKIDELALKFDIKKRTIYRDIDLLKDAGFLIEKDKGYKYFIKKYNASAFDDKLLSFSVEEAAIIKDALLATHSEHPLKNQTLHKLFALSELDDIVEIIYNQKVAENIRNLKIGIKSKKQVVLKDYHSSSSNTVKDRLIEPISFHKNLKYIFGFEIESKTIKQFKPDRADMVMVKPSGFKYKALHQNLKPDFFGMNSSPKAIVDIKMNIRAANLLKEEFPGTIDFITETNTPNYYLFSGEVQGYEGVGRFILGLPGDIEVLGDKGLIKYLEEKRGLLNKFQKIIN